jgi:hypothetical protein
MRRTSVLGAVLVLAACTPDEPQYEGAELVAPVFAAVNADHFGTHATGAEEVPANTSRAQGQVRFTLGADGETLHYRLIVANIENVTQAHIHRAAAGANGGIVVWLYPSGPPSQLIPGRTQGVLAEGTLTNASVIGTLAGTGLDGLLAEIRAGNAYVNVHTSQFPPGEIRGQLR